MHEIIVLSFIFFCFYHYTQAEQLSPEEKDQQAADNMQKRLGLKERQIQ